MFRSSNGFIFSLSPSDVSTLLLSLDDAGDDGLYMDHWEESVA